MKLKQLNYITCISSYKLCFYDETSFFLQNPEESTFIIHKGGLKEYETNFPVNTLIRDPHQFSLIFKTDYKYFR